LIIYAITPDIADQMDQYEAVRQRVADPARGRGFFDGNTRAPRIDLRQRDNPIEDLTRMGRRLVEVVFEQAGGEFSIERSAVEAKVDGIALEVAEADVSTSNRREMMRRISVMLLRLVEEGVLEDSPSLEGGFDDGEV